MALKLIVTGTVPVIYITMISGAIAALVWLVVWYLLSRRKGGDVL